ncbi:MAG: hypothetical protein IKQ91_11560 [Oscillospiraceae bacterium]|nr:hypothetical protein [Oscillospiraceae bacterium]
MKIQWFIPVMLGAVICLTGCGRHNDLNIQENAVPVIPVETTVSGTAVSSTETDTAITSETETTDRQATAEKKKTTTVTNQTVAAAGAAETAAAQGRRSNTGSSGGVSAANMLYGKWETVSFTKDSGEHVAYDLSDPVHRSYYVGLDLNESGQSSLTVGTETHPATISEHDNILTADTVSLNHPVSMVFKVSEDRTRMTAELMNGRVIATLNRINRDFSIRDFLNTQPEMNISALTGEWYYLNPDQEVRILFVIQADGTFTETQLYSDLVTTGTVKAEKDCFAFYDSENRLYLRFTPDPLTPNTYQDDNPEDGRLVSVEDYEQPNAWGFYEPVLLPAGSISVAALYGMWKNADGSGGILEIDEGRTDSRGRFELTGADGKSVRGEVRLQYLRNQSGEKEFCFSFYTDSGELSFAVDAVDTVQPTDLYGYQSGEPHFIRQK